MSPRLGKLPRGTLLSMALLLSCKTLATLGTVASAIANRYPAQQITTTDHEGWQLQVVLTNSSLGSLADPARHDTALAIARLAYRADPDSAALRQITIAFVSMKTLGPLSESATQGRYVFWSYDFASAGP